MIQIGFKRQEVDPTVKSRGAEEQGKKSGKKRPRSARKRRGLAVYMM
jgi:hypothetical protein